MRKQINQKPSYKYGEKIRTKNILRRVRRKESLKNYLRIKYFLKLANLMGNANIGFINYASTLNIVERANGDFINILKDFGYKLAGKTIDELTPRDIANITGFPLFKVPVISIVNVDTKAIQKTISAIPHYQQLKAEGNLSYLAQE